MTDPAFMHRKCILFIYTPIEGFDSSVLSPSNMMIFSSLAAKMNLFSNKPYNMAVEYESLKERNCSLVLVISQQQDKRKRI